MKKNVIDDMILFEAMSDIDSAQVDSLIQEAVNLIKEDGKTKMLVLDLIGLHTLELSTLRKVSMFSRNLKKMNIKFYILHGQPHLSKYIASEGLDNLILCINDLKEFKKPITPKKSVDVNFLNPFIEATVNTLKIQCSFNCTPGKPFIKNNSFDMKVDIAGVIAITSDQFKGNISVCFTEKIFLHLMSNMLGEECSEINSEMEDGAGELVNIIFGQAKMTLNQLGYTLQKAIPTIVRGGDLIIKHIVTVSTFILPFNSDLGEFYIEIGTES
jgi:chemotaxis protein CheX